MARPITPMSTVRARAVTTAMAPPASRQIAGRDGRYHGDAGRCERPQKQATRGRDTERAGVVLSKTGLQARRTLGTHENGVDH